MQTFPLILENGHLLIALAEGSFLFDTGAPTSFGKVSPVNVAGQNFNLPPSYMGLTVDLLSTYVKRKTDGILGGDILNRFDLLIDVPQSRVCFSESPLDCLGEELALEEFMGVPILHANIAGESARMFFDTGAQISYFQGDSLSTFPAEGMINDFYPGIGPFSTETFRIPIQLGSSSNKIRCGQLPAMLGMTLMLAGTQGIVGNEVLLERMVGYFPRRHRLILM
jgi:hypothetical protein